MTTSAILAWAWEGGLLVVATELLLRGQRRLGASASYAIWMMVLLVVAIWPTRLALVAAASPAPAEIGPVTAGGRLASLAVDLPALPTWAADLLVFAWMAWATVHATRLAGAYVRVRRIAAGATPLHPARQSALPGWTRHRGAGRRVTLAVSDALTTPAALGLGSPCIVLPREIVQALSDADLDRVVLHELAHLRRWDDWTQLLQGVVQAGVGFHPAIRWIARRLDLEREAACDAFVVRCTEDARGYAACLAQVAARSLRQKRMPALASGAGRAGRQLEHRVRRVLDPARRPWPLAAAVLAVPMNGALVTGGAGLGASLIVFEERSTVPLDGRVPIDTMTLALAAPPPGFPAGGGHRPAPVVPTRVAGGAEGPVERPSTRAQGRADVGAGDAPAGRVPRGPAPSSPPPGLETAPVDVTDAAGRLRSAPLPDTPLVVPGYAARQGDWRPGREASRPSQGTGATRDPRNVWVATGTTVGSGVEKAGVKTAGALTRFGRSIASAFSTGRE